jgi:hypothetical protein
MPHWIEETTAGTAAAIQAPGHAPDPSVWAVFTRPLHQLDAALKTGDQIRETLEAIRQASDADVVCWPKEQTGETLGAPVGPENLVGWPDRRKKGR